MRYARINLSLLLFDGFADTSAHFRYHFVWLGCAKYTHEDLYTVVAKLVVAQVQGMKTAQANDEQLERLVRTRRVDLRVAEVQREEARIALVVNAEAVVQYLEASLANWNARNIEILEHLISLQHIRQALYRFFVHPVTVLAFTQARRYVEIYEALIVMQWVEQDLQACWLQRVCTNVEFNDGRRGALPEYGGYGFDADVADLVVAQVVSREVGIRFDD